MNSVAHSLAHYARQVDEDTVWLEESPPPALEALYLDSLSIHEWMKFEFGFKKKKKKKNKLNQIPQSSLNTKGCERLLQK